MSKNLIYSQISRKKGRFIGLALIVAVLSLVMFSGFIIIFSLVFNEVIIINFQNLDYNTNKRIKEREKIEKNISSYEMNQLMNDTASNEE